MNSQQLIEIPSTSEKIVNILKAVPPHWSWIQCHLDAPRRLLANNLAEWNTGFFLTIESRLHCKVVGRMINNSGRRSNADFLSVAVMGKSCGFVEFKEADYQETDAKDILIGFIKKGYYGTFSFSYYPNQINSCIRATRMYPILEISVEGEEKEIKSIVEACYCPSIDSHTLCVG